MITRKILWSCKKQITGKQYKYLHKQQLKQHRPVIHSAPQWPEDAIACLQGLLCVHGLGSLWWRAGRAEVVFSVYIKFCMDTSILVRTIRTYLNSKPWITQQIKHLFNIKKHALGRMTLQHKTPYRDIKNEIFKDKSIGPNKDAGPDGQACSSSLCYNKISKSSSFHMFYHSWIPSNLHISKGETMMMPDFFLLILVLLLT